MRELIAQQLLCTPKLIRQFPNISKLDLLKEEIFRSEQVDLEELKRNLFVLLRTNTAYQPDYHFHQHLDDFINQENYTSVLLKSIKVLASNLEITGEKIHIKSENWNNWQDCILSISPLLLICNQVLIHFQQQRTMAPYEFLLDIIQSTCLPSVHSPILEHQIFDKGVADLHIHLNGTSEPDLIWGEALRKPEKFVLTLQPARNNQKVKEQQAQFNFSLSHSLKTIIDDAKKCRHILINHLSLNPNNFERFSFNSTRTEGIDKIFVKSSTREGGVVHTGKPALKELSDWQHEGLFLVLCLENLYHTSPNNQFAFFFHQYLLRYHYFQQLVVQQKDQVGFEQFQKITLNEMRSQSESDAKSYSRRFHQLQSMYGTPLTHLEGRFSPKSTHEDNVRLISKITNGYKFGGQHQNNMQLALVMHLIKEVDYQNNQPHDDSICIRHAHLRDKNRQKVIAAALFYDAKNPLHRNLYGYERSATPLKKIIGFDAAANELHTPPEVFAPIFRKLRYDGQTNFTYHAGEDFKHLISGIRAVYEAIEFLELSSGNRIGHATALGIEPALWQKRFAKEGSILLPQGEWLDNLIFAFHILSKSNPPIGLMSNLEREINKLFLDIYETTPDISIHTLIESWQMRKLEPEIAFGRREPGMFDGFEKRELEYARSLQYRTLDLLEAYHSSRVIKNYQKLIHIHPEQLLNHVTIRQLQNEVLSQMITKDIAIESLFSSNVRISFYKNYQEHHIFRWLGLTANKDPRPSIVLGTDDTGIFMTNIRNEYTFLFLCLKELTSQDEALKILEQLRTNGEIYRFR